MDQYSAFLKVQLRRTAQKAPRKAVNFCFAADFDA